MYSITTFSFYLTHSLQENYPGDKPQQYEHIYALYYFFKILFINFLVRAEGKEKEGEKYQCANDTLIGCFLKTPNWGA